MAYNKVSERLASQYPIVIAFFAVRWSDALYSIESPSVVVQSTCHCRDEWDQVAIPADAGYFLENEIHSLSSDKGQRQNDGVQRARAVDSTQATAADRGLRLQVRPTWA